jgi:putative hydrolase of the HAD superfamily
MELRTASLSSVRAVLFDAVGTLIYSRPSVAQVYFDAGQRCGSSLTLADIKLRFDRAFQRHTDDRPTSEQRERKRWQNIVSEVFTDVPDPTESLFETLWDHFAQSRYWELFPDVSETWEILERRQFIIGIASNFDKRLVALVRDLEPLRRASHVFCSSRIGISKPHLDFFRSVQSSLRLAPHEILLVGDDCQADVQGALAAGWRALLLDRSGSTASPGSIRELDELIELVPRMSPNYGD